MMRHLLPRSHTAPGAKLDRSPAALRLVLLPLLVLAGCANMADTPPGTPVASVIDQFGQPTLTCPGEAGSQRMIWSQQPMGQYAWGTNVSADGRIGPVEPVLTDAHFSQLATGVWTPDAVRCEFGPPADISGVGLPSNSQTVWSYRYKQSGVWNSLMYVYFGQDGQRVTRFHPGPDPMFDDRDNFWLN